MTLLPRLPRKEGAQFRPLFCLPFFFFLVRPLFSFLAWRAIFLRALFSPSFFFQQFWLQNRVFELFFPYFYSRPLSPSFFFLLKAPSFFFFLMEGSFFCALFSPSFFFSPSFLLNLMPYCLWYDVFVPQLSLINELPYILFDININRSHK